MQCWQPWHRTWARASCDSSLAGLILKVGEKIVVRTACQGFASHGTQTSNDRDDLLPSLFPFLLSGILFRWVVALASNKPARLRRLRRVRMAWQVVEAMLTRLPTAHLALFLVDGVFSTLLQRLMRLRPVGTRRDHLNEQLERISQNNRPDGCNDPKGQSGGSSGRRTLSLVFLHSVAA